MGLIRKEFYESTINAMAAIFKILGHPCRLTIISILLKEGPQTNGQLVERIGLAQSTVSQHLSILGEIYIVMGQRRENCMVYSIYEEMWDDVKKALILYATVTDTEP